uniref:cytochrome b n=1 Tax=Plegadiphilus threskiornis TaxID=2965265 RepID=UPI0026E2B591|nr:cytochrome b [Plegadiphilus threskiornis]WIM51536.1 cytochrome b [Plegadiphilus threskiornis]
MSKELKNMIKLPTPSSISLMWNFGSLLGLFLMIQILTGIFLAMHYNPSINLAFQSVVHIMQDVNFGWMIRFLHANGATFFFIFIYLHISRGLFYKSYHFTMVWVVGLLIFLLFMGEAFLGYVLPWGQMSYWGATVITNLISAVPYLGSTLVEWLWGGFSVSEPTLTRFFTLHFFLPMGGVALVFLHLLFLHNHGSSNPLGLSLNSDKITFHPYFTVKDLMGFLFFFFIYIYVCLLTPFLFMDPDNFILANPMVTPPHIQPEWYFLFAYAILRSIPSKLGGVIALLLSILVLMLFPLVSNKKLSHNSVLYQFSCCFQFAFFFILTWLGALPVEDPYFTLGQYFSFMYFFNIFLMMLL